MMFCAGSALAEISLNISVEGEIQPGVYGRIDFGVYIFNSFQYAFSEIPFLVAIAKLNGFFFAG